MNIRKCSICEAHELDIAPRKNEKLCAEHQDWDDILHVTYCKETRQQHAGVNIALFCYKHNPDWPPMKKSDYSDLDVLTYRSREHYDKLRDCLVCARVGSALDEAIAERASEAQVKIAVWRPFICDLTKTQMVVKDEATAIEKGMLPWKQKCVLALCVATSTTPEGSEDSISWSYEPVVIEFIAHYERWCHHLTAISTWDRRFVDLAQMNRWLHRCKTEHGEICGASWIPGERQFPSGFRLIDTEHRCVILPENPSKYDYATLSYVWAKASASEQRQKLQLQTFNLTELAMAGSLDDARLPEVVADALHLCSDLSIRYLWVDRFCIAQDDLDLKSAQIDAMGAIYDAASLSIVALADGPTPGLPGVSSHPRPRTLHNWSWDLLAPMSNPVGDARPPWIDLAIMESRWNDRAWTFQERLFSKRRVYFDANHIYGQCTTERWTELPPGEDEGEWAAYAHNQDRSMTFRPSDLEEDAFGAYRRSVSEFSPRKLTLADDVLRAFTGVSAVYQMRFSHPVLSGHPQEYFTESLRWLPRPGFTGKKRDVDFVPSWSWASWAGPLTWDDYTAGRNWVMAPGIYLTEAGRVRATLVDFYFSSDSTEIKRIAEHREPLDRYITEQKRLALSVIKSAAGSWWPGTISEDPKTVETSRLDMMTDSVWEFGMEKAREISTSKKWPPTTAGIPNTERLHDLDEDDTAMAALRNIEEHTVSGWWPPAKIDDGALRQLKDLPEEARVLAQRTPNSLIFNTSCAKLTIGRFGRAWFKIPPRRHISGAGILRGALADLNTVGFTMAMAPELTHDLFREPRECLVALMGVCSAKRYMQWDEGERGALPVHHLNELCLFVMIMDEDAAGVCRRAAIGVVFAYEWMKCNPEWRTVVLA